MPKKSPTRILKVGYEVRGQMGEYYSSTLQLQHAVAMSSATCQRRDAQPGCVPQTLPLRRFSPEVFYSQLIALVGVEYLANASFNAFEHYQNHQDDIDGLRRDLGLLDS
jgi:hypothetical protein